MNQDTTYLTGRPYQEVVDDLLTALIGGVVPEKRTGQPLIV